MPRQVQHGDEESERRTKRYWPWGDIMVIASYALAAFGLTIYTRHAEYHRGLTNTLGPAYMGEIVWVLPLGLLAVAFFLYGMINLAHSIIRLYRGLPANRSIALDLLIAFLPLVTLIGSQLLCLSRMPIFMRGFERWATENVDVDAVQRWLASEGAAHASQTYDRDNLGALPSCLVQLKPWHVRFQNGRDYLTVELSWGSERASHRGVVVGPPDMALPLPPTTVRKAGRSEYKRAVAPGVYVVSRWY